VIGRAAEGAVGFQAGLVEGGDGLDAEHGGIKTILTTEPMIGGGHR
jgi:hypothetical protein